MNWKLILLLSLFGLAMGILTISLLPESVEPYCWPVVMIVSGWLIARRAGGKYFMHGVALGLVNCIWVTAAHEVWLASFVAHNPHMVEMSKNWFLADHIRRQMAVMGVLIGLASGVVMGLLALLFSVVGSRKKPAAA